MTVGPAHKHEPATFTPSFQLFQGCVLHVFEAHYDGSDTYIYTSLSLSASLSPRRHTALHGIKDKQALPFPLTSRIRILPDFFSNSTLSFLFVLRTTCRLEIGFHWIHRTLGEILENFGHLLFLFLPGLDLMDRLQHGNGHSGFFTDFS